MSTVLALLILFIVIGVWFSAIYYITKHPHKPHYVHAGEFLNLDEPDCGDSAAAQNRTTPIP